MNENSTKKLGKHSFKKEFSALSGVFSQMTKNLNDSKISWRTLLRSKEVRRLISDLYKIDYKVIDTFCNTLRNKLRRMIASNGIITVCKAIKAFEHAYNLKINTYVSPMWITSSLFFKENIPIEVSRIFLTLHRNMFVKPVLDIVSIQTPSATLLWHDFCLRYKQQLDLVGSKIHSLATPLVSKLMGDYFVKKDPLKKHEAWNYIGNLSNDPTVDSNSRTGGMEHPLRVTTAMNANGPALSSQLTDAWILSLDNFAGMRNHLQHLFKMLDYKVDILTDGSLFDLSQGRPEEVISKVVAIQDKSCKSRTIAIFDTYSQVALRPIHFFLEHFLKKISRTDFTFDHDKGIYSLMKSASKDITRESYGHPRNKMYSFDVTSATDTIPKELGLWAGYQAFKVLINDQFTEQLCQQTWHSVTEVLINRDFKTPDGGFTRYTCGQPMGAYGSFPLLALSQHSLVWLAAEIENVNVRHFTYAVVGDDLVIHNDKVGLRYAQLCKELGIPINTSKSIVSQDSFEFCKRVVVGEEIRKVPSLSTFYVASMTGSPGPLIKLYNNFRLETPKYKLFGRVFGYDVVRHHISVMHLTVRDGPTSEKLFIPEAVLTHAERCIFVEEFINSFPKVQKVVATNPYLQRLNYGSQILSIFKNSIKKLVKTGNIHMWTQLLKIRANTFYLGYEMVYHHFVSLRRMRNKTFFFQKIQKEKMIKLRRLCMRWRNTWSSLSQ